MVLYNDTQGKENDLKEALDNYEIEINEAMSQHFNKLKMVLEHENNLFKFLIECDINRNHKVGVYPIEIKISGLFKEFSTENNSEKIKQRLSSQNAFDEFKKEGLKQFELFINFLKFDLKKQLEIDDIESYIRTKIVIPKKKITKPKDIPTHTDRGIYNHYHGFDNFVFYCFIWSDIMHHNSHIRIDDSYYENETGDSLGYAEELNANNTVFDSENSAQFENNNTFQNDPEPINVINEEETSNWFDSNDSWFDSDSSTDSWFDSSCSSCSNCSSCSSCAGCGGD